MAVNLTAGATSATLDRAALDKLTPETENVASFRLNFSGNVSLTVHAANLKEMLMYGREEVEQSIHR